MEGEEESSLPPGYVSLAQLQERWLKKQEEKKLKEKREEERRNSERGKRGAGSVRDGAGRRGGRYDGEIGVIDDKGKGKAIVVDACENGVGNKNNMVKKGKKKRSRKKNFAGDRGNEKVRTEKQVEMKVIVPENGLAGVKEIESVAMVEMVVPGKGGITDEKREDVRGQFRKNGYNRGSFPKSGDDCRGRLNDLRVSEERLASVKKMEDEKGYDGKKWRERGRRNGVYRASRDDEPRKKAEAGISEGFREKCGISEGYENVERERNKAKKERVKGEGLSDDMVALDKKEDDKVLVVESAENGKYGGIGKGYRRYDGNQKGNFGGGGRYSRPRSFEGEDGMGYMRHGNWKGNFGREGRYRSDDCPKVKQGDSGMIWVKKGEISGADAVEVGPSGVRVGLV